MPQSNGPRYGLDSSFIESVSRMIWSDLPMKDGGQELIWPEVIATIGHCESLFLPFDCPWIERAAREMAAISDVITHQVGAVIPVADVLYLGTPTIVNDTPMFGVPEGWELVTWTKQIERAYVKSYCGLARAAGYKKIVTGLGTGDVTLKERLFDMGPGSRVVACKDFGAFTDYVLLADLRGGTDESSSDVEWWD